METIKNYLESMFLNLPNTPEVQKAKYELGQMMEDKYTELLAEGKAENEAVGIVISEFGNLDELAGDLGIGAFMNQGASVSRRNVTMEEVKKYFADKMKEAYMTALGVLLCITSPAPLIFLSSSAEYYHGNERVSEAAGTTMLFVFIAIAVGLFIYASMKMSTWSFLKNQACSIDYATAQFVHNQKENSRAGHALLITVGVILCILSVVPAIILDSLEIAGIWEEFSGALVLIFVAIGVFMLVLAGMRDDGYNVILRLNESGTVGANFVPSQNGNVHYSNPTVAAIMSVYWPTVTCAYLIWSFLSFDWHITWIIWPVAGIISSLIKNLYGNK